MADDDDEDDLWLLQARHCEHPDSTTTEAFPRCVSRRRSDEVVINAYKFFLAEKKQGHACGRYSKPEVVIAQLEFLVWNRLWSTRSVVAQCLGIAASTVSSVWAAYNDQERAEAAEKQRGRRRSCQDDEVAPVIRQYVNECNEAPSITAKMVADEVAVQTNICIARRSMSRLLKRLGYRYIMGEKRHYLAETVGNVAYRATYLQRKLLNRDRNNNPILPGVYLDES
ncbi:hypothetical protein PHYPSEUDO_005110 [Phytophthora pseudosyringae]|uniref:Winged helix-turn helix domain-containing protein n=1 Tax=Phytophthora pseudosyringae TaxID=221518 RepID=A0A8T1VS20_9STRA|nr:hypothetical protein PHYPSEUDO_005110 [Phytophthora pseudosyringae]